MPEPARSRSRRTVWFWILGVLGVWALSVLGIFGYESLVLRSRQNEIHIGDGTIDPLFRFRIDGIVAPRVVEAQASELRADEEVIGVEVAGHCRAYRLDAFRDRSHHVVNDVVGGVPVTVTFCDISNCVRSFTDTRKSSPLDVAIGGLFEGGEMILDIGGVAYFQKSGTPLNPGAGPSTIPLEPLATSRTTWGQWKREHPTTDVYQGDR